jgi:parallel beta-helix repeat protein
LGPRDIDVTNSSLHDNNFGIEALVMVDGVLQNNIAYDNNFGFNVGGQLLVKDNLAYDNILNGVLVQGSGTTVSGGEVYDNGGAGVLVLASNFLITGIDVHDNADSGIYLNGSTYGTVSYNNVHNNSLAAAGPEIELYGNGKVNAPSTSAYNTVSHNTITGSDLATYGILESQVVHDNVFTDNIISHTTLGSIVAVASSEVSGNTDSVLRYGSSANDKLSGGITRDVMYGGAGNDTLNGGSNADTLVGGIGIDKLTGGLGDDVFRFTGLSESYRTAGKSYADVITDFDVAHDKIDLASSALSLTVLGNGHNGTLQLAYNEAKNVTYLKNFDENSLGQRFELTLNGNYLNTFTNANLQKRIDGTSGNDTLTGSSGDETLLGGAGRDTLKGGAGADRIIGGAGGDTLTGGTGADTFVFTDALHSTRTGNTTLRDTITDFNALENDKIELTALNFTGLGNGHNGTLKVVLNAAGTLTALKSLDANSDGSYFEIMLSGNHLNDLNASNVIFDPYSSAASVSSALASPSPILLVGVAELQNELTS